MSTSKGSSFLQKNLQILLTYLVVILLLIAAQTISPGFLNRTSLTSWLRQISFLSIVAIGQTLVILSGGINLSVASGVTLANVVGAQLMAGKNENALFAFTVVVLIGLLTGLVNGSGIYFLKISPLVMTLAMDSVLLGAAYIYCQGAPKGATAPFVKTLATGWIGDLVPINFLIFLILGIATVFFINCTTFGRDIKAIGTNVKASSYSGVRVAGITILIYCISGVMSSIVGFLLVGYSGTSYLNIGTEYSMNSIAAVVLGGTSIAGGLGGYTGTVAGAAIVIILQSILTVINIPDYGRSMIHGLVLIVILLLYAREKKN